MPASFISTATPSDPTTAGLDPSVAEAKKKLYANTEGRATEVANDPYQKASMDYLQGVIGGKNVPYSDEVKNSILAQQGQGSADAEAAQMASLRESLGASGGSIYDPGYQAAQRQAMSQRQGRNLDAMGQLNATAGVANQQAQQQGAVQLAGTRGAQNAQVNQLDLAGAGYRAQTTAAVPTTPAAPTPAQPKQMTPWEIQQQISAQNHAAFNSPGIW